jgi:hypothetical protein
MQCSSGWPAGFVVGTWCSRVVPRRHDVDAPRVVMRTARVGLRVTPGQRRRCFGLLVAAGDVWSCLLDMNRWRRHRGPPGIVNFQELCRELHQAGPGVFGELPSKCAEGVLRRFCDAWFATAKRRRDGDVSARFPRRKRRMVPVAGSARGRHDRHRMGGPAAGRDVTEQHLPGAGRSRRDPRRRPHHDTAPGSPGRPRPAPQGESLAHTARISQHHLTNEENND